MNMIREKTTSLKEVTSALTADAVLLTRALIQSVAEPALVVTQGGEIVGMNEAMRAFLRVDDEGGVCITRYMDRHQEVLDSMTQWSQLLADEAIAGRELVVISGEDDRRELEREPIEIASQVIYLCKLVKVNALDDRSQVHRRMFMGHCSAMLLLEPKTLAIIDANLAAAKLYHTTRAALKRLTLRDLELHGEDSFLSEGCSLCEHAVAGERRFVELYSSHLPAVEGSQELLFVVANDVTEQEHARIMLNTQERVLAAGESITQIGSWEWDVRSNEQFWSRHVYEIFGVEHVMPRRAWFERIVPEDQIRVELFFEHLCDEEMLEENQDRVFKIEHRWRRSPCEAIDLELRVEVISEGGEVLKLRGSVQDVTALRNSEREVADYAKRLEQVNRDLEDFASMASHDLREPARKVVTFGERLLSRRDTLDERAVTYVERMANAGARMENMIDSLLELSSYSRRTNEMSALSEFCLQEVMQEVSATLEIRIEEYHGQLDIERAQGMVIGHRGQLFHLFQNLIGNALKFHVEGEPPLVEVFTQSLGPDKVRVVVRDHGIGMDQKFAEDIFKPFKRLHGRKSCYEGEGIGLSICKKIVENHNGQIQVQSVPGEGASFLVDLPVKACPA